MQPFKLEVSPVTKYSGRAYEAYLLRTLSVGEKELVATIYGESREIASMRAELLARAINQGARDVND